MFEEIVNIIVLIPSFISFNYKKNYCDQYVTNKSKILTNDDLQNYPIGQPKRSQNGFKKMLTAANGIFGHLKLYYNPCGNDR